MGIKSKYINIKVKVKDSHQPVVCVMSHEVGIYKMKFGESNINLADYQNDGFGLIDDLHQEFDRLKKRYGCGLNNQNQPKDLSYVEELYGNIETDMGLNGFKEAIESDPIKKHFNGDIAAKLKSKNIEPKTNTEESVKISKENLNKGALLRWFDETQGITTDDKGKELKSYSAKDLTVFAKAKLKELADEMEKELPGDDLGTKSLTRLIISYQEEG